MNERLRELFKMAGGKSSTRNLMSNPVQVVETHELWDDHIEKFAELIVRECAKVVFEKTGPKSALNVLEHFGIEE